MRGATTLICAISDRTDSRLSTGASLCASRQTTRRHDDHQEHEEQEEQEENLETHCDGLAPSGDAALARLQE
jgi:hypothetical protein